MELKSKSLSVRNFDTSNTAIKAKFATDSVIEHFHTNLKEFIEKEGAETSAAEHTDLAIEGDFIMIDEGNRFLRWFVGPFGLGAARIEIEGTIKKDGGEGEKFFFKRKGYGGFGGGKSENLLKNCAKALSKDIVKFMKKKM